MPAGNQRPRATAHLIARMTAMECVEIARRIQSARLQAGDQSGAKTARLVARLILEDVLGERPLLHPQV